MTTRVATPTAPPISLRAGTALQLAAAIIVIAVLMAVFIGRSVQGSQTGSYVASLQPVVERHNQVMDRWNSFVMIHNATAVHTLGAYDAQAEAAYAEVSAIAAEASAVAAAWAAIVPPESHAEPHGLVLVAMTLTEAGISGVAAYFSDARTGDGNLEHARQSLAKIDEAAAYWAQAKSFDR